MEVIESAGALNQLLIELGSRGFSTESLMQVETYVRNCWDKGVVVQINPIEEGVYATYNPSSNVLSLNPPAFFNEQELMDTLEHEYIHVLQDQTDGIDNAGMQPLGLPLNYHGVMAVVSGYEVLDPNTQLLEMEASSNETYFDHQGQGDGADFMADTHSNFMV